MASQKIAVFDHVGDGTDFTIGSAPVPEPGPNEVRFKVAAFALNQADLLLTKGRHYVEAPLPIRVGYEGCGTVDAVGADITRFRIGDRVTCLPNALGPYWTGGEYAVAQEDFLTDWPDSWSAAEASSLWMQYLTPYFPFAEHFPFRPGSWVMITAASGGTGLGSIAMAKLLGARVIATTRSESKVAMLRSHGADVVLSTGSPDFIVDVMKATDGKGVRLICDTLSGPYVATLTETLADQGIMFIHGALGSDDNMIHVPLLNLVYRRAGLYGYSLINELKDRERLIRARDFVWEAVVAGRLPRPTIDEVFPLNDVRKAYDRMRSGRQTGKIIVSVTA
ncbi:MAG: zinc-dependent alcohol dehydrogenase family protein [Pseudomonadota bacterium]